MADYTKQDIFDIITEYLETYGSAIGSGAVRELSQSELTDETLRILTIPSMLPSTEEWVQTSLHNMMQPITNAVSDLNTLKSQTIQAKDAANAAATRVDDAIEDAEEATDHAENVNATLVGMTVTVTDRNGQSRAVNIGFEIAPEHVYASKNAMKADAANVLAGQFCMIATTDPTDPDNATLWSRNNQPSTVAEPYTFLSDLDQASTSAWADWMNNQKPLIIAATDAANAAAILANAKAVVAQTAATNADNSRIAIEQNEATRQANEAQRVQAETQRQTDWTNFFSDTLATGCRKLWNDFWTLVTTSWTGFWGTSADDPNGVRKQWTDLRADAISATQNANTKAGLAQDAANLANEKAGLANTKANLANEKAGYANTQGDYAKAQGELLQEWNTHQPYIGDGTTGDANYWYIWYNGQYVKSVYAKGDDLHWEEMTQEEREQLAAMVLAELVYATPEETRAMLDELT